MVIKLRSEVLIVSFLHWVEIIAVKKALKSSAFTSAEPQNDTAPGFHLNIQLQSQCLSCTILWYLFTDFAQPTLQFLNVCPNRFRCFVKPHHPGSKEGMSCRVVNQRSAKDSPSARPELLSDPTEIGMSWSHFLPLFWVHAKSVWTNEVIWPSFYHLGARRQLVNITDNPCLHA